MPEDFNNISFDLPKNQSNVIKVIGVGGGGSNAVNHMYSQGIKGVDFVICNTDAQALQSSPIPTKIQLGVNLTEGLGAGANPEVGAQAAEESIEEIKQMLGSNSKMVFITVGMGGGTGTGAAPVIARIARGLDLLTIGIVTIPFSFEGKMRNEQAERGIEKLREYVDSMVVINNNKLREVYGNLGFKAGFSKADEVLSTASRGIAEVITHHYTQNIDLKDAKTVLSNSGTAIMGSATASGTNRAEDAISKALDSPLLNDNKITGAKNVLLLIVSGIEEITIDEIGEINDYIQSQAKSNVNIIMGIGEDESLGEDVAVTIVATGFHKDQQHEISNTEAKKVIHILENEQEASVDLSDDNQMINAVSQDVNEPEIEKVESKVVFDLGDEEDEFEIIPTTEFVKNIDVVYEEVAIVKPEEFIITDVTPIVEEPIVEIKEKEQIAFTFEFPIPEEGKVESTTSEPELNIREIEVIDHKVVEVEAVKPEPVATVEPVVKVEEDLIRFSLDEFTELEESLTKSHKPVTAKVETVVSEDLNITLSSKEQIEVAEHVVVDYKEVSPLDLTISELQKTTDDRREKMKKFNYKFQNNLNNSLNKNIQEIEKEPAYKRMGVELDKTLHSSEINQSRTTLEVGDEDIQLRSNNSFLHDNVD